MPRFCPSLDQSSPGQLSHPLGFGQVLSDQPAASRLEHLVRVLGHIRRSTGTIGLCCRDIADREEEHDVTRAQVLTVSHKSGLGTGLGLVCIWLL
ncbi:unnamed protein product [Brassica rapa subsp. trilocularis]